MLGCSVLKFSPNIFLIKSRYQALGQVFKFVLRCYKFDRIGHKTHKGQKHKIEQVLWADSTDTSKGQFRIVAEHQNILNIF